MTQFLNVLKHLFPLGLLLVSLSSSNGNPVDQGQEIVSNVTATDELKSLRDELEALRHVVKELQQKVKVSSGSTSHTRNSQVPPHLIGPFGVGVDSGLTFQPTFENDQTQVDDNRANSNVDQRETQSSDNSFSAHQPEASDLRSKMETKNIIPTVPTSQNVEETNPILEPKVRLYSGPNGTGTSEDINFKDKVHSTCLKIMNLSQVVESLDTFGTCVRLYNEPDCEGHSMAYYPRSTNDNNLDVTQKKFLKSVRAISPCFENELDNSNSEVSRNSTGVTTYRKFTSQLGFVIVPDLVYHGLGPSFQFVLNRPVHWFRTGHGGRVEMMRGAVQLSDVLRGQREPIKVNNDDVEFYNHLEKMEGDQLGHFMGSTFGPQQMLPFYNIFPQNAVNRVIMNRMEKQVMDLLTSSRNDVNRVRVNMYVDYENGTSTRPMGMSCVINYGDGERRMMYMTNMIPNATPLK